jgi:hypothetical protein
MTALASHFRPALAARSAIAPSPVWTIAALTVAALSLVESFTGPYPALSAGIALYPHDFLCGALAALFLVEVARRRRAPAPIAILLILAAAVLAQTLHGILTIGLATAGNEARNTSYFLAAAACFGAAPPAAARRALKIIALYAGTLVLLALARWTILAFAPSLALWGDVGGGKAIRVLNAAQALLLCQSALLAGVWALTNTRRRRTAAAWILLVAAAILVLQQRSVWLVAAIGALWLFFRTYSLRIASWRRAIAVSCILLAAAALIVFLAGGFSPEFLDSLTEPADPHSTLAWRIKGWEALLTQPASLFQWLFGCPFGTGYLRTIDGALRDEAPHNFYLQTLLRSGIAGVALLVAAYGALFFRTRQPARQLPFAPLAAEIIALTQLVFFFAYSPTADQGLLLGIAAAIAYQARQESRA